MSALRDGYLILSPNHQFNNRSLDAASEAEPLLFILKLLSGACEQKA